MVDKFLLKFTKHPLLILAKICIALRITPLKITLLSIPFAIAAFISILLQANVFAGICVILNRICDGLDGTIARQSKMSNASGGYIDIVVDYLFYALIPLAHGLANPTQNMVPALFVLFAYVLSGINFLAMSSAAKSLDLTSKDFSQKKIYYSTSFIEGTETILYLTIVTFFPRSFVVLSYITVVAITLTLPIATYRRWKQLAIAEKEGSKK